jgi:nucleotidyltransferase/DNA polymerase involved in DNA repair
MDAFFAAVEARDNPKLRSKPVVVGSDPKSGKGRGVVSACSYEARRFGIRSAMPISEAYRRCPEAVFLPVDIEKYSSVSKDIYEILYSFTPDIEPVGIDEAFLDITGSHHLFGTPLDTCRLIKSKILSETGLTASIGLASSKIASKIASDLKKPDGLVEVPYDDLAGFLKDLEVRRLWGLGPKAEGSLKAVGVRTIGELASMPLRHLRAILGSGAETFWNIANGIDDSTLSLERKLKSVSNERTFDIDTSDREVLLGAMLELSENVASRLRKDGLRAKTLTIKIRLPGFKTHTRSMTFQHRTNVTDALYNAAKELYNEFSGSKIRLVGVRASNLSVAADERDLFTQASERKLEEMDSSVDRIRMRFGDDAIYRASVKRQKG